MQKSFGIAKQVMKTEVRKQEEIFCPYSCAAQLLLPAFTIPELISKNCHLISFESAALVN